MNPKVNNPASIAVTYKAELMLLFVTLTWGLSFPILKILLQYVSPFMLVAARFTLTLILFVIFYGRSLDLFNINIWKSGLILGVLLFLGYTFQTIGLYYTTASKSAFITGINLIFIPFIQYFVLRIKPGLFNMIGAIFVMAGLYIFTGIHLGPANIGDILTIFCALCFAVHIVLLSKFSESTDFIPLVFGQFLAMSVLSIISTIFLDKPIFGEMKFDFNNTSIVSFLILALFSTFISLVLMTKYQSFTTPFRAGIIYNTEAVFAAIFAYYILNEVMSQSQVIAAIVIIAGLLISEAAGLLKLKYANETSDN